jgi:hypothetical protein
MEIVADMWKPVSLFVVSGVSGASHVARSDIVSRNIFLSDAPKSFWRTIWNALSSHVKIRRKKIKCRGEKID